MKPPPRRAALTAAIALATGLLAACGSAASNTATTAGSAAAAASGADPALSGVTLRIGQTLWPATKTEFELAGLDKTPYKIEWSVFPGGDKQLVALGAGAIDVANTSDIPPIFSAAAGNTAFKVVALSQGNTLLQEVVAGPKSGITSIAGLKGKKVAYVKSTTAQYFLAKLLAEQGLSFTDITPVPLSPADGATALSSGSVDALASYGSSLPLLEAKGAIKIGSGETILSGNFPIEAATDALGDPAKKAAIVDYLGRLNKAAAYAREHAQDFVTRQIVFTKQPLASALAQFTAGETQRPTKIVATDPAAVAKEQDVADTFVKLGALKSPVDVKAYWSDALSTDVAKVTSAG